MIFANTERSGAGLLWTVLLLVSLIGVFLLVSSLEPTQALTPLQGVDVHKSVSANSVTPGELPPLVYTVVFSNSNPTSVTLDFITDTLPTGFMFIDMVSMDDPMPYDTTEPEIAWRSTTTDPITVPASGTLSLAYYVYVPPSVPPDVAPRINTVTARVSDTILGPATASIIVGQPDLSLSKEAWPEVLNGGLVTYTVTIANDGHLTDTVTSIVDAMDPAMTFTQMLTGSDVMAPPQVIAGKLFWADPLEVPPLSSLTLLYQAEAPTSTEALDLCNQVEVSAGSGDLGPVEVCIVTRPAKVYHYLPMVVKGFSFARFTLTKTASPEAIVASAGQVVLYTVSVENVGDTTGTLTSVADTLPPGFTFQSMAAASDVLANPTGTTGTIEWQGNWVLASGDQLHVIYEVLVSSTPGRYTNVVDVTTHAATPPGEPAEALVAIDTPISSLVASNDGPTTLGEATTLNATVSAGSFVEYEWDLGDGSSASGASVQHVYPDAGVYTATVTASNAVSQQSAWTRVEVKPAVLLEDHFEDGIDRWTKFMNYHRLSELQWYWEPNAGVNGSGCATQNAYADPNEEAEDALLMYLGPGATDWTDYRLEAKMVINTPNYPQGFWVRGQYQDVDDDPGGWVTGYYIMIGGNMNKDRHYVSLKQLQTLTDCWDQACNNPGNLYDFNNPHELTITKKDGTLLRGVWHDVAVEVRGANIKIWLNDVLYVDYTDPKEPFLTGTVGLKTFKGDTVSFDDVIVTPLD
ncbi:MAG: PKD domain-containing protein [Anaerolineae bacterium]|jgi:uncharacterized repeat protein (TIGR01451 family)